MNVVRSALLAVLLLAPVLVVAQPTTEAPSGRIVEFPLERFDDTLYAAIDTVYRVKLDDRGHLWYSTQAGVVHVDVEGRRRDLYTRLDGLPSSFTLGLDVRGDKVYAGTELGLAIIDVDDGSVVQKTTANSPLPDAIVQEVLVVGDEVWLGTYFSGVAVWNLTTDEWRVHNTSTTAGYAKPVRRLFASADSVWIATDGDGLWRHDRATGAYEPMLTDEGLVVNEVRSVLEAGSLYVGTTKGLQVRRDDGSWLHLNKTNTGGGLPDDLVLDLDLIRFADSDGPDLFVATRKGLARLDLGTGEWTLFDQTYGVLGTYVLDAHAGRESWAIATQRGVSLYKGGNWTYYATGPSATTVPSNGPHSFLFTSASVGNHGALLWFGTSSGISAFYPAESDRLGMWRNFGEWSRYPGGPVNWIDTQGGTTWVGSNSGVYALHHDTLNWTSHTVTGSRNLVYGLDVTEDELYIALFGDGLVRYNFSAEETKVWTAADGLPDLAITDVRVMGNDVWLGSSVGVIRMDRLSGTFTATYTVADGLPGFGIVFRVLPELDVVWVAMKEGGVARLDVRSGRVSHVWNATNTPGFPEGEVRSLHREGNRLWAGTTDGLARIDLSTQAVKVYRASDSGLVQNYVNGITSRDGILYLPTLSGLARLDIEEDRFLPMHEGPGVSLPRADAPRAPPASPVRVGITTPRDLELVSGVFEVTGTAQSTGGAGVDRVEVSIAEGDWQAADGTTSWSFLWDTTKQTPDETVTVRARAFSGGALSRTYEVLAIPVEPLATPLRLAPNLPQGNVAAGRALALQTIAEGDDPLVVNAYYKSEGATQFTRLPLAKQGALWTANAPATAVKEGVLQVYFEARSGSHVLTEPAGGASAAYALNVTAAPRLALALTGPSSHAAVAGEGSTLTVRAANTGTLPVSFTLVAQGKRPDWVRVPAETFTLQPGEARAIPASLAVPAGAFADTWTLTFEARDVSGVADPATYAVPLTISPGSVATPTPAPPPDSGGGIPGAGLALLLPMLGAAALLLRRRS